MALAAAVAARSVLVTGADEDEELQSIASSDGVSIYYDTVEDAAAAAATPVPTLSRASSTTTTTGTATAGARSSTSSRRVSIGSSASSGNASPAAVSGVPWAMPALWSRLASSVRLSGGGSTADGGFADDAGLSLPPSATHFHRRELSAEETEQIEALVAQTASIVLERTQQQQQQRSGSHPASPALGPAALTGENGLLTVPWGGPPLPVLLAMYGRTDQLARLLGSAVHRAPLLLARDASGQDALMSAVRNGHTATAALLLHAGADPNTCDNRGVPTLLSAVMCADSAVAADMVNMLLTAGADVNLPNAEDGLTPLMMAALIDRPAISQRLLAAGANVNLRNDRQEVALMFAASRGLVDLVAALLARGGTCYDTPPC